MDRSSLHSPVARLPRFHADNASLISAPLDQAVRELTAGKGYEPHHEHHFANPCPTCRKPVSVRGCVAIEGALVFHAGCR